MLKCHRTHPAEVSVCRDYRLMKLNFRPKAAEISRSLKKLNKGSGHLSALTVLQSEVYGL